MQCWHHFHVAMAPFSCGFGTIFMWGWHHFHVVMTPFYAAMAQFPCGLGSFHVGIAQFSCGDGTIFMWFPGASQSSPGLPGALLGFPDACSKLSRGSPRAFRGFPGLPCLPGLLGALPGLPRGFPGAPGASECFPGASCLQVCLCVPLRGPHGLTSPTYLSSISGLESSKSVKRSTISGSEPHPEPQSA